MSRDEVAVRLHEWADKDMKFRPSGRYSTTPLPTQEDFAEICRGQLVDIWKYVSTNVYPLQTVKKVQGNLLLRSKQLSTQSYRVRYGHSTTYSQEIADLQEHKRQLEHQLHGAMSSVEHIEQDMERLQREILQTEQSYSSSQELVANVKRKTALLKAYSERCTEETDKYKEYTSRITHKIDTYEKLASHGTWKFFMYSDSTPSSKGKYLTKDRLFDGDNSGLETACTRKVRETCEEIGSFLHQLLQGHFSDDKVNVHQKKERLWKNVEEVIMNNPISQVVMSLIQNTQESAYSLRERTARIDITKDAEKLRFRYQERFGGQLTDVSQSSMLKSVHQLIEESQLVHIQSFTEAQKYRNQTNVIHIELDELMKKVDGELCIVLRDNEGALELARVLVEAEKNITGTRAGLSCLSDLCKGLKAKIDRASEEKKVLFSKYQKIQDFQNIADSKQSLIRVLVKQNTNARPKLMSQKTEIQKYIQSSLCTYELDSQTCTLEMKNYIVREINGFAPLCLPNLMFIKKTSGEKVAVHMMSVNQLTASSIQSKNSLTHILNALLFPLFKGSECVLKKAIDMKWETVDIVEALEYQRSILTSMHRTAEDVASPEYIAKLCESVQEHDKMLLERVLPLLQQRTNKATQAVTDCLPLKDYAQAWWEQPAQFTVPWVHVDGSNLQQWRDKYTVSVTQLRQLQYQS